MLIPLGFISVGYSVPMIRSKTKPIRLREIKGLKIIFVSLAWGIVTVVLPMLNYDADVFSVSSLLILTRRILFIFAITIPFDIRDSKRDLAEQLKTIPLLVGERKAKIIAITVFVGFFLLAFLQYNYLEKDSSKLVFAFFISALVAGILTIKASAQKSIFYFALLDGTMILQFFLLFFFDSV